MKFLPGKYRTTVCLLFLTLAAGSLHALTRPYRSILVIHSYNIEYQWTADIQRGFLETVHDSGKPHLICTEFLDWKRFPQESRIVWFSRQIAEKYPPGSVDLVVVSDDRALEFAVANRETLFSGLPIVHCGVFQESAKRIIDGERNITGVYEDQSVFKTIETALFIQPNPRAAYLISDLDPSGQASEQRIRQALGSLIPRIPVRSLSDLTIAQIEREVSSLGKQDLVFIGSYSRDKSGLIYTGEALIERVANASGTPVYVLNTHHLGTGALGGYLFSPYIMGKHAGSQALQILDGIPADSIPPVAEASYVMLFDHDVVERFSITSLPPDSRFINRQPDFWEVHGRTVLIMSAGFGLCFLFILMLLVVMHRQKKLSQDLAEKNTRIKQLNDELAESDRELRIQLEQLSTVKKTLEKSEEQYRLASIGSNDALWDWDYQSQRTHYSDRWFEMTGFSSEKQGDLLLTDMMHPDDRDRYTEAVRNHMDGKTDHLLEEVRVRTASGSWKWIYIRGTTIYDATGNLTHITGSITDIDDRKTREAKIETLAYFDPLTSLPNRTNALQICREMIKDTPAEGQSGIIFVNITNFTLINNMFGHATGDKVLVNTANILSSMMNEHVRIARFGGDQFILFISETSTAFMEKYAQLVIRLLSRKMDLEGRIHYLSVNAGVALYPDHAQTPEDLFQKADAALHRAKILGNAGYYLYNDDIQQTLAYHLELETALRTAIDNGEIYVAYQPQINLLTGKIDGLEALARWNYPRRGDISPGVFIPIAEQTGQIDALGFYIVQAAVNFIKRAEPLGHTEFTVSVNVSVRQMQAKDFVPRLIHFVKQSGVAPQRINVEITESFLIESIDLMAEKLTQLRDAGFLLSLDDFGKGYSSLAYLKELPVHFVKIDKAFIDDIRAENRTKLLAESIITLSHKLGLKVVAEGVEYEDQYLYLKKHHCDIIQGYYFSKPESEDTVLGQMELSFT